MIPARVVPAKNTNSAVEEHRKYSLLWNTNDFGAQCDSSASVAGYGAFLLNRRNFLFD